MLNLKIHVGKFLFFLTINNVFLKIIDTVDDKIVNPYVADKNKRAVIFFHGYGEETSRWQKTFEDMNLSNTQIILPVSKGILVDGRNVSAWFRFNGPESIQKDEDEDYMSRNMNFANTFFRAHIKNGTTNIVIGGFDQGGSIALMMGTRFKKKLAGVFALSSWLPHYYDKLDKSKIMKNRNIPVLVCHGAQDQEVPFKYGQEIVERLENETSNVSFRLYHDLEHDIKPDEMIDVRNFIMDRLNITETNTETKENDKESDDVK